MREAARRKGQRGERWWGRAKIGKQCARRKFTFSPRPLSLNTHAATKTRQLSVHIAYLSYALSRSLARSKKKEGKQRQKEIPSDPLSLSSRSFFVARALGSDFLFPHFLLAFSFCDSSVSRAQERNPYFLLEAQSGKQRESIIGRGRRAAVSEKVGRWKRLAFSACCLAAAARFSWPSPSSSRVLVFLFFEPPFPFCASSAQTQSHRKVSLHARG